MPRRQYKVPIHPGCGEPLAVCECVDGLGGVTCKVVSVTDDRDVEPLVESARLFLQIALDFGASQESVKEAGRDLRNALAQFEEGGEDG